MRSKNNKERKSKNSKEENDGHTVESCSFDDFVVLDKEESQENKNLNEISVQSSSSSILNDFIVVAMEKDKARTETRFTKFFKEMMEEEANNSKKEEEEPKEEEDENSKPEIYKQITEQPFLYNYSIGSMDTRDSSQVSKNSVGFRGTILDTPRTSKDPSIGEGPAKPATEEKLKAEQIVDMEKVISLQDRRATLMIKNIPIKFDEELLINIINQYFENAYDLFILPRDVHKKRNFGYAFINFTSSYYIPYFYSLFHNKRWSGTGSQKICEITYADSQGKNNLSSRYQNKLKYINDKAIEITPDQFYYIPIKYLETFREHFPKHPIEEMGLYFKTKMPLK